MMAFAMWWAHIMAASSCQSSCYAGRKRGSGCGRLHPGKIGWVAAQIALEEATFAAAPAFHADRSSAPHYRIDGGGAKLRAQGGERPTLGIEHAHSTLAVDEDGEIAGIAIAGHRDVQNLFGLPQECFHNRHIGHG